MLGKDEERAALAAFMRHPIPSTLGFVTRIKKVRIEGEKRYSTKYIYTGHLLNRLGIKYQHYGKKRSIMILPCENLKEVTV